MDFCTKPRLRAPMVDDKAELIRQLYTRVGMAMEDASVIALTLGGPRSPFDKDNAARLEAAINAAADLLNAATALQE